MKYLRLPCGGGRAASPKRGDAATGGGLNVPLCEKRTFDGGGRQGTPRQGHDAAPPMPTGTAGATGRQGRRAGGKKNRVKT